MPKFLLLKHYRGGPEAHRSVPPMDQWAPEDVEAHMAFLKHVSELLRENGEYVDAQALTPTRTFVRYGGPNTAPVTTDGPNPETSDLVAGWYMIDVESYDRAVELAAYVSSEPGPGGEPLYEWIEVREVMTERPPQDQVRATGELERSA
ncbi:MAG TPA: YciI family protein [Actinopolymorphaceae bacterium]